MQQEIKLLGSLNLVGIATRTNNYEVFTADPKLNKISLTIEKYVQDSVALKIKNRLSSGTTFAVYTNYQNNEHGDYTYFIGEEVASFQNQDPALQALVIPSSYYAKFTSD